MFELKLNLTTQFAVLPSGILFIHSLIAFLKSMAVESARWKISIKLNGKCCNHNAASQRPTQMEHASVNKKNGET